MGQPFALTPNLVPTDPKPEIERAPMLTAPENRPRYVGDERNAGGLGVGETIDDYYRASIGDSSAISPASSADPGAAKKDGCCG